MSTCNKCGTDGLRWVATPEGWRLFHGDVRHICGQNRRDRAVQAFAAKNLVLPKPPLDREAMLHKVFVPAAWRNEPNKPEPMPPEAMEDYNHRWWDFLEVVPVDRKGRKKHIIEEAIP